VHAPLQPPLLRLARSTGAAARWFKRHRLLTKS
jgi:hypothetical protein